MVRLASLEQTHPLSVQAREILEHRYLLKNSYIKDSKDFTLKNLVPDIKTLGNPFKKKIEKFIY